MFALSTSPSGVNVALAETFGAKETRLLIEHKVMSQQMITRGSFFGVRSSGLHIFSV